MCEAVGVSSLRGVATVAARYAIETRDTMGHEFRL